MRPFDSALQTLAPRAASLLADARLPIPFTVTEAMRDVAVSNSAVVGAPQIDGGRLTIPITTERQRDRVRFTVPPGFSAHNDLVAAAVAPLLRGRHRTVHFEFPVSERVRPRLESRTGAEVTATGTCDPRRQGANTVLGFSGGMDSLAAWLLAPESFVRLAIDFGPWFRRERRFFETQHPDVICATDLRSRGYAGRDHLFMVSPMILYADHLDLGWVGRGTNFESSPGHLRAPGWAPPPGNPSQLPRIASAVGLRGCDLVTGLTEFGGSLVVNRYAPHLVDDALRSLARARSEKVFRKRLAYDSAVAWRGGPPVDLERRELPRRKIKMWTSYPVDFAMVAFMTMFPRRFVQQFVADLDPELFDAASAIRPDFLFRCHPAQLDRIPNHVRPTAVQRMAESGLEPYHDDDWTDYEKFRRILSEHYSIPD